ncbi:hypothetical protein ACFU8X_14355 [Brevibacillus porteri]|uniref:hypothetical protein n=1 Tax=Brevibacillus porteri TaxID=2126350 RepID=UPI00370BEB0B
MVRKISRMLLLMTAIAVSSFFPSHISANEWKKPTVTDTVDQLNGAIHQKQEFRFPDGVTYWAHKMTGQRNMMPYVFTIPIQGNSQNMMFRYRAYDESKKPYWRVVTLDQVQTLPLATGFVETEGRYIWLGKPITYVDKGSATIEEKTALALPVEVKQTASGVELVIKLPMKAGYISEMWALDSREPLVPWGEQSIDSVWLNLDVTEKAKWLYDGYYYQSPSTYEPTSESSFWRIPENYVLRSFLYTGGSKAARDMGYVMLKASLKQQEPEGYWKTQPRSLWLSGDYGIPEGFYDTRFNTGAADLMLRGCDQYQEKDFCQSAKKYVSYFHNHAALNHFVIAGVQQGWLVSDYATATNPMIQTHVSLNHQLAEINFLYKSYMQFGDRTDRDLADIMLYGVVNLGSQWVLGNGDLHYAYFPDGTFGRPDYPFLTYNDLVETQRLYRQLHGMDEMTLAMLIDSKWMWMQLNNIQYR